MVNKMKITPSFVLSYAETLVFDLTMAEEDYKTLKAFCQNKRYCLGIRSIQARKFNTKIQHRINTFEKRIANMLYYGDYIESKYRFVDEQAKYDFIDNYQFLMTRVYSGLRAMRRFEINEP